MPDASSDIHLGTLRASRNKEWEFMEEQGGITRRDMITRLSVTALLYLEVRLDLARKKDRNL